MADEEKECRDRQLEPQVTLKSVKEKFNLFLKLLDKNNRVLEIMSDMEEKAQGEYLFDITYILDSLRDIRSGVQDIIHCMITLGGEPYRILQERFEEIDGVLNTVLPGRQPIVEDDFTVPFDKLNRTRAFSVGSKNAQLGEMKAVLHMPVPEGFAITARAYQHFVEVNNLQSRIAERIDNLDIKNHQDLVRVGDEIRDMITSSPVPDDLRENILQSYRALADRAPSGRFSMRSSAVGEDTLFSFAGQYASYLNVREDQLIDRYREVLAGKFTPQAIYYFLSHSLSEAEFAMSVGCVSMVDAAASGVMYTRNPVNPDDDSIIVNSIFGLGKYLVSGYMTPDLFRVSRTEHGIIESQIVSKPVCLVVNPDGGVVEEEVPVWDQMEPSLTEDQIRQLAKFAVLLEDHYRRPQDIEWSIDRDGNIFFLQSRPLQLTRPARAARAVDTSGFEVLFSGGTTVSPGAGSGPVYHVSAVTDLPDLPAGAVLVAPQPFPGLITAMGRVSALVAQVGGLASHMATIAREYHVPTLAGVKNVERIPEGKIVTVDATDRVIYAGDHADLVESRRPEVDLFEDSTIHKVLDRVLDLVSPLRLLHPSDEDFIPENCVAFHDITRYAHQKAMEEMFQSAREMGGRERIGVKFKSDLPVDINIIYIDRDLPMRDKDTITEKELGSDPMIAFWKGIKKEGWPARPWKVEHAAARGTNRSEHERHIYSESSFAVLSREYMILSLAMGYHFTSIEAMCTDSPGKNYISMQYKEGGASLDRRIRRIKLLAKILSRLGFAQHRTGDFLHSILSYQEREAIQEKLATLGRLTLMTKQLDMALSSDAVTEWYTQDFMKKLGLDYTPDELEEDVLDE